MYKHQKQVLEFHEKFGLTNQINKTPTTPSAEIRVLRVRLLLEEVLELAKASGVRIIANSRIVIDIQDVALSERSDDVDLVEVADALSDIQYVNDGAAVAYGLDLEPLSEEVHRSNMSKLWPYCTMEERFLSEDAIKYPGILITNPDHLEYRAKKDSGVKSSSHQLILQQI